MLTRKDLIRSALATGLFGGTALASHADPLRSVLTAGGIPAEEITAEDLRIAAEVMGVEFSEAQRTQTLGSVRDWQKQLRELRKTSSEGVLLPLGYFADGHQTRPADIRVNPSRARNLDPRRLTEEDIAFLPIRDLASLIRQRKLTSTRVTQIFLDRIRRFDTRILSMVTVTEALALRQAAAADREIAAGRYRGLLHGIPYTLKDLYAVPGYPTTWGAAPYERQRFSEPSSVYEQLSAAGAVLLGKASLGALAMGDQWFRGRTNSPWNVAQGSSGSSAGSAAGVAAGFATFSIGSETSGSIVSPSLACRITGLRTTFGRVSRHGAMELCFSMDKVGIIAREAEDTALVLASLLAADDRDPSQISRPLRYRARRDLRGLRIGVTPEVKLDDPFVEALRRSGATVREAKFTPIPDGVYNILFVEAASAFDDLTRGAHIDELKNSLWPQFFRLGRYMSAVDYLKLQRMRGQVVSRFATEWGDLDAVVTDGIGSVIYQSNLSGHPQILIPQGATEAGRPRGKSILARPFQEGLLVEIARVAQDASDFHRQRPPLTA